MQLQDNEYVIKKLGELETITITRAALESWRDHYTKVSKKHAAKDDMLWAFYTGKAGILTELLKHFDDEND